MRPSRFSVVLILLAAACSAQAASYLQKFSTLLPSDAPQVPAEVRQEPKGKPWQGKETMPVDGMVVLAGNAGVLWLGSDQGAARFDPKATNNWDRIQYFAGRRWLPDNTVSNIWLEPSEPGERAWIRTKTGVSLIEWKPMTLEQKSDVYLQRIEARHVRHGFVSETRLRAPDDTTGFQIGSNDNDGLWTAMNVAAECYRYAVTKNPEAAQRARRGLQALMRLEEITGVPGFYARSFIAKGEPLPGDGEWHPTPDGKWMWKGDTSSDETVGHYFAYAAFFDLVADEEEKESIRKVVSRITDFMIAHDYDLPDLDGKPTRWGQWSLRYFQTEEGRYEAPLRSIEMLSFLKAAHHITVDIKYHRAYLDRIEKGYAENMRWYRRWKDGGGEINFSDDELAFLSYQPLLKYERDRKLRDIYLDGLRFTWGEVRPDFNPLWNYIAVASGAGKMPLDARFESRRTLERFPMDLRSWAMKNSHRKDVVLRPEQDRFGVRQITTTLAPDERVVRKWNSNPYIPDGGGDGHEEDDGTTFLLPYWMGRFYGWVL